MIFPCLVRKDVKDVKTLFVDWVKGLIKEEMSSTIAWFDLWDGVRGATFVLQSSLASAWVK